jgi:predicted dehydrogenase
METPEAESGPEAVQHDRAVGIGIVGYGGFGRFLHETWAKMDRVRVEAVADNGLASVTSVPSYSDWKDLLTHPGIDLVAIATPPAQHAEIACAALAAGKHVIVEKPIATTRKDAQRVLDARNRSGRVATVDFMLRFNPVVEAIHAWCSNKAFGELRRVLVENYAQDESLPPGHWFWSREDSGGILVEHAVHFIDIVQGCRPGRATQVFGARQRRNPDQEDRMLATVIHEGGLTESHYHAFSRPKEFERTSMRFVFDLAEVDVRGWIPMAGEVTALVNIDSESELDRLPGFRVTHRKALPLVDETGGRSSHASSLGRGKQTLLEGAFAMFVTKAEAYAAALRGLMNDVLAGMENPGHPLRVTLEDAIVGLEIALRATEAAGQD